MQLLDVVRSLRNHWRMSLAIMLVAVAVVAAFLLVREETRPEDRFRASVQVLVPTRESNGDRPEGVPATLLQGQQALALRSSTTDAAVEAAGLDERAASDLEFDAFVGEDGDTVVLAVTASQQDAARQMANRYARAYTEARREVAGSSIESRRSTTVSNLETLQERLANVEFELQARGVSPPAVVEGDEDTPARIQVPPGLPLETVLLVYERNTLVNRIESARDQYASLAIQSLTPPSYAEIVERTASEDVTPEPASPLVPSAAILGIGLVLAVGAPIGLDRFDRTLRTPAAAGAALGAPVLGRIPVARKEASLATPGTARDLAFRSLAATSVATDRLPDAIMVTAPSGDAHDAVAANYAAALAGLGLNVALLPTLSRQSWYLPDWNGADDTPRTTLPELLRQAHLGRVNGDLAGALLETGVENLRAVAPGDADELAAAMDGLPPLLHQLSSSKVDVTVIAGPPLLENPDATIFAWAVRHVLWVVRAGEITEEDAAEARARLELAGVAPFGVATVDTDA